jgi:hypothetical protein
LLVTAISFLDFDTAIFRGKSPSGKERPAGEMDQPLGSNVFLPLPGCAQLKSGNETKTIAIILLIIFLKI